MCFKVCAENKKPEREYQSPLAWLGLSGYSEKKWECMRKE